MSVRRSMQRTPSPSAAFLPRTIEYLGQVLCARSRQLERRSSPFYGTIIALHALIVDIKCPKVVCSVTHLVLPARGLTG